MSILPSNALLGTGGHDPRLAPEVMLPEVLLTSPRLSALELRVFAVIKAFTFNHPATQAEDLEWCSYHDHEIVSDVTNRDIEVYACISDVSRRKIIGRLREFGLVRTEGNQKRRRYTITTRPWALLQGVSS